jgi:hypothetical protein
VYDPVRCVTFLQFYTDRFAELTCYVQPNVVEEIPPGVSPSQHVADLEIHMQSAVADSPLPRGVQGGRHWASLEVEAQRFIQDSGDGEKDPQLLLVLGEAGSGKSMFTWLVAKALLQKFDSFEETLGTTGAAHHASKSTGLHDGVLWIPVVIDLKHYRMSQLRELLPTFLKVP